MNRYIKNKGVNALRYCSREEFCLPGHEWPGYGSRCLERSVGWYSDSLIWRSAPQPSLARCFSSGIKNAHKPTPAEGVYALAILCGGNRKWPKRPPVQRSVVIPNPGVNARAKETDGVNKPACQPYVLRRYKSLGARFIPFRSPALQRRNKNAREPVPPEGVYAFLIICHCFSAG